MSVVLETIRAKHPDPVGSEHQSGLRERPSLQMKRHGWDSCGKSSGDGRETQSGGISDPSFRAMAFWTRTSARGGGVGQRERINPARHSILAVPLHPRPSRGPGRGGTSHPALPGAPQQEPRKHRCGLRDPCQGPRGRNGAERPEGPGHTVALPPSWSRETQAVQASGSELDGSG